MILHAHPAKSSPKVAVLLRVARIALESAERRLPAFSHKFSPKKFTQPQLVACVILRLYLRQDYRGICALLEMTPALVEELGLRSIPHYSTLDRFALRALNEDILNELLAEVISQAGGASSPTPGGGKVQLAMDSTGVGSAQRSEYFAWRSGQGGQRQYVKLSLLSEIGTMHVWAAVADLGPSNDATQAQRLLIKARHSKQISARTPDKLFADKGYDSERVHQLCEDMLGATSYIPLVRRARDGTVGGRLRSRSEAGIAQSGYGYRWHVESVFSAMKRILGSTTAARRTDARLCEAVLRALTWSMHRSPAQSTLTSFSTEQLEACG